MCFFTHFASKNQWNIGQKWVKQGINIDMGIDHAPFLAELFLYFSKSKCFKQIVSLRCSQIHKHGVAGFNNVSPIKFYINIFTQKSWQYVEQHCKAPVTKMGRREQNKILNCNHISTTTVFIKSYIYNIQLSCTIQYYTTKKGNVHFRI